MGRQMRQQQFSPAATQRWQISSLHALSLPHVMPSPGSHSSIGTAQEQLHLVRANGPTQPAQIRSARAKRATRLRPVSFKTAFATKLLADTGLAVAHARTNLASNIVGHRLKLLRDPQSLRRQSGRCVHRLLAALRLLWRLDASWLGLLRQQRNRLQTKKECQHRQE
jgi:hypothetical protein